MSAVANELKKQFDYYYRGIPVLQTDNLVAEQHDNALTLTLADFLVQEETGWPDLVKSNPVDWTGYTKTLKKKVQKLNYDFYKEQKKARHEAMTQEAVPDEAESGGRMPLHWSDAELLGERPSVEFAQYVLENSIELFGDRTAELQPGEDDYIFHALGTAHPEPNYWVRFMIRSGDGPDAIGEFQVTGAYTNGRKISIETEEQLGDMGFMRGVMAQMAISAKGLPTRWIGCYIEKVKN